MAENKTTTLEREDGPPQGTALDLDQPDEDRHQRTALNGSGPEPTGFTAWMLARQDHEDGRIGHLAQEIAADDKWPRQVATLDDALDYLARAGGTYESTSALTFAWETFEREELARCPKCGGPSSTVVTGMHDQAWCNDRDGCGHRWPDLDELERGTTVPDPFDDPAEVEDQAKVEDQVEELAKVEDQTGGLLELAGQPDLDDEKPARFTTAPAPAEDEKPEPASESSKDDEDQDDAGPAWTFDDRGRMTYQTPTGGTKILLAPHRAELHSLGLTDDDIVRLGIFSNPQGAPGWILPWTDGHDEVRPVIVDRDKRGDGPKLAWPKDQTLIVGRVRYVEGSTRDIIVEGPRQALMVATYAPPDRSVFVMNGADGIHKGIADRLRIFDGCQITLMVDGDWRRNQNVGKAATERAPAVLDRAGVAEVLVADVGGKGTDGIDDILLRTPVEERAEVLAKILDDARPAPERRFEVEVEAQQLRLEAIEEARRRIAAKNAEDRPPPEVTSLAELLAEPDPDVRDRVAGLWPKDGNVVLAAQRKAGKTTLVGNLVRSLVDGEPFLAKGGPFTLVGREGFDVVQLADDERVLIADLELSRRTLRRWLRDQKIENVDRVLAESFRGRVDLFDVLDEARRGVWAEHLAQNQVRVLIIDPLAPLLAHYGYEENDNTGVSRVLAGLDALKAAAGVEELLVVHHMGHGPERSRGASRLRDWPDAEWRLVREGAGQGEEPPPDAARFLIAEGRDVMVPETRLEYDDTTRRLSVAGGGRVQYQATKHAPAILELVKRDPGMNQTEIVDLAGKLKDIGRDPARRTLRTLVAEGKIHTAKGPTRSTLHFLDDECATPDDCQAAHKDKGKDQGK